MRKTIDFLFDTFPGNILFIFGFTTLMSLMLLNPSYQLKPKDVRERHQVQAHDTIPATRIDSVRYYLKKYDIHEDSLVLDYFQQESGINMNSKMARMLNNISGMQIADLSRPSTSIGIWNGLDSIHCDREAQLHAYWEFGGYAIYKSIEDCVKDFKYFQQYIESRAFIKYMNNYYKQN